MLRVIIVSEFLALMGVKLRSGYLEGFKSKRIIFSGHMDSFRSSKRVSKVS